jgi:hypothetical protein
MKATKRFLSAIMAMTMVCGTAVSVSADVTSFGEGSSTASGTTEGSGAMEGYANKDVLCVVLPTTNLNFVVDPQGLIKDSMVTTTNKAGETVVSAANTKYKNATFEFNEKDGTARNDGFIFFAEPIIENNKQTGTLYSNHLDLKVENKSSYKVTVTPSINYEDGKVSAADGAAEFGLAGQWSATGTTFGEGNTKLVGFKLSSTEATTLNGVADAYEVKYGKTGYTYELNQETYKTLESPGNVLEVTLTGASNPGATNWDTVNKTISDNAKSKTKVDPKVTVTWTIAKATEG